MSSHKHESAAESDPVAPFLVGAIVGGLVATAIALIIGEQRAGAVTALRGGVDKRRGRKRKQPRFELLLQ